MEDSFGLFHYNFFIRITASYSPSFKFYRKTLGCDINEAGSKECVKWGINIGSLLSNLFILGWLSILTIPAGIGLVIGWTVNSIDAIIIYRKNK